LRSKHYRKPSKADKARKKRRARLIVSAEQEALAKQTAYDNWKYMQAVAATLDHYVNEKLLSRRVSDVKFGPQSIYFIIESSEKYWEQVIKPQLLLYANLWKFPVSFSRQKELHTLKEGVRVHISYRVSQYWVVGGHNGKRNS